MGYYVQLLESNFRIPPENVEAAFEAMKALNTTHHDHKTGGRWPKDGTKYDSWFAWMPADYDETAQDATQILRWLGFEDARFYDDGSITMSYYNSKTGDEELFLSAIAPYVENGSYLQWVGEEGDHYQHVFKDGRMETQYGRVVFGSGMSWPDDAIDVDGEVRLKNRLLGPGE